MRAMLVIKVTSLLKLLLFVVVVAAVLMSAATTGARSSGGADGIQLCPGATTGEPQPVLSANQVSGSW